jgi:hypothetical protein
MLFTRPDETYHPSMRQLVCAYLRSIVCQLAVIIFKTAVQKSLTS